MSEQTNIPTVEETNRRLSEPVRPASAVQAVTKPVEAEVTTPEEVSTPALACDECDFVAKTASGLKSHARKHAAAQKSEVTTLEPAEETPGNEQE